MEMGANLLDLFKDRKYVLEILCDDSENASFTVCKY